MCLKPIKIRNPTRYVHRNGGQQLLMNVPCGQCAECVTAKRNEWYFRANQHVKSTLMRGGYILFDTLTYRNQDLPHISDHIDVKHYGIRDFSCFSHADFKGFLKRLRRQLEYHCGNSSFTYFLTSEYGTDERFTHRPHYHIMFFITSGVHPYTFSKLVSKCWTKGRTDGLPYQSRRYVAQHVYGYNLGYGMNTDFKTVSSLCNYVSKYITKSSKFKTKLEKRVNVLRSKIEDEDELKKLIRQIDMFHRQSQGFGLSYLSSMTDREIDVLNHGKMIMEDSKKVIKTLPLSTYYKRHLFYQLKKRPDNTYYWEYTDYGIRYKNELLLKSVTSVTTKYQDIIDYMKDEDKQTYVRYMQGRNLTDYVIYKLFYQGRSRENLNPRYGMTDNEYNLFDYIYLSLQSTKVNSVSDLDRYEVDIDTKKINTNEPIQGLFTVYRENNSKKIYPIKEYYNKVTFNHDSCPEFHHYDKIEDLLNKYIKAKNLSKQRTFDYIEDLKDRLKQII